MSWGGWTGSVHFSTNVGDATNRTKFVQAVVQLVNQYQLDGVDFEYVRLGFPLFLTLTRVHS